jgi:hypothetical protein
MTNIPNALYQFQQQLSCYLRNPKYVQRPHGIAIRPARIYEGLLFNNICSFLDACFPVTKSLFTDTRWRTLCRWFFRDWPCHTPYFSKIPEQFVCYASANHRALKVPAFLPDLLHYEYLELEVETAEDVPDNHAMSRRLTLHPSVRYARYHWPVHQISAAYRPRKPNTTFLLLHRDAQDTVKFLEVNEMTTQLLDILASGEKSARESLTLLAKRAGYSNPEALLAHGHALLVSFIEQKILQGKLS